MKGKRYVYTCEGCKDVVTVCHVVFDGDLVMMDTDCWFDRFDITSYNEWIQYFEPTRKKSQTIERYQAEIANLKDDLARRSDSGEMQHEIDRLEGILAVTEMEAEKKNARIRNLEHELEKLRAKSAEPIERTPSRDESACKNPDAALTDQKTHIAFLEHELEKLRAKNASPRYESVFPKIFDLLFAAANRVESDRLPIAQSVEIRAICRTIAEISETQHRAIVMTKKPFIQKPFAKKNKIAKNQDKYDYDKSNYD
ncbi:MAG: hypothetical protein LBL04_12220 [Bacteroidales bacterium]|jgi:hypothetical protein|nr:hypothetical protein [Bacteroidales bacterium]